MADWYGAVSAPKSETELRFLSTGTPWYLPERSPCCWAALVSLCSPLIYSIVLHQVTHRRTLTADIFFCCTTKSHENNFSWPFQTSWATGLDFLSTPLLSPAWASPYVPVSLSSLPVTTSLGDGSSAAFMYSFQVCCHGLAGCYQGYFDIQVMFWCLICSPSPGSSSYINLTFRYGRACFAVPLKFAQWAVVVVVVSSLGVGMSPGLRFTAALAIFPLFSFHLYSFVLHWLTSRWRRAEDGCCVPKESSALCWCLVYNSISHWPQTIWSSMQDLRALTYLFICF